MIVVSDSGPLISLMKAAHRRISEELYQYARDYVRR